MSWQTDTDTERLRHLLELRRQEQGEPVPDPDAGLLPGERTWAPYAALAIWGAVIAYGFHLAGVWRW